MTAANPLRLQSKKISHLRPWMQLRSVWRDALIVLLTCSLSPLAFGQDRAPLPGAVKEIKSPRADVPSLMVTVEADVSSDVYEGPDFVVFNLEKGDKYPTLMQVYVGNFPTRLAKLVKGESFVEEPANFIYERAAWFSWMADVDKSKEFISVVYLYNIFMFSESLFIVQIKVSGADFEAVQQFKAVAAQMKFKGIRPGGKSTDTTRDKPK